MIFSVGFEIGSSMYVCSVVVCLNNVAIVCLLFRNHINVVLCLLFLFYATEFRFCFFLSLVLCIYFPVNSRSCCKYACIDSEWEPKPNWAYRHIFHQNEHTHTHTFKAPVEVSVDISACITIHSVRSPSIWSCCYSSCGNAIRKNKLVPEVGRFSFKHFFRLNIISPSCR